MTCTCQLDDATARLCPAHQGVADQIRVHALAAQLTQQTARAIDAVQMTAMATCRIIEADAEDVPRLLISAACRSLERLIEYYRREQTRGQLPLDEQGKLRAVIQRTADDLAHALDEGLDTTRAIVASLTVRQESIQ